MRLNLLSSCLVQFVVSKVKSDYYRHKYLKSFSKLVSSVLIPTQTSTAPTKKKGPWHKVSLFEGAISSQRDNLVFFSNSFFPFLSVYGVFLIRWQEIIVLNFTPRMACSTHFSKLEIIFQRANIFLPVLPKIIICTCTGSKNAFP